MNTPTKDPQGPGNAPQGPEQAQPCPFCDLNLIASLVRVRWSTPFGVRCHVFEPLNPVTTGHLLVAPAAHAPHAAADPALAAACMDVAAREAARHPSANILTSIGAPATQTIAHLHLHVVPRTPGDGLTLPWSPRTAG